MSADLPIGLPLASCFWHFTQSLAILSPLGSSISALICWYPHSEVTSGTSSNMRNVSAFCHFPHMEHTAGSPLPPGQPHLLTSCEDQLPAVGTTLMINIHYYTLPIPSHLGTVLGTWTYEGPDHTLL